MSRKTRKMKRKKATVNKTEVERLEPREEAGLGPRLLCVSIAYNA